MGDKFLYELPQISTIDDTTIFGCGTESVPQMNKATSQQLYDFMLPNPRSLLKLELMKSVNQYGGSYYFNGIDSPQLFYWASLASNIDLTIIGDDISQGPYPDEYSFRVSRPGLYYIKPSFNFYYNGLVTGIFKTSIFLSRSDNFTQFNDPSRFRGLAFYYEEDIASGVTTTYTRGKGNRPFFFEVTQNEVNTGFVLVLVGNMTTSRYYSYNIRVFENPLGTNAVDSVGWSVQRIL